LDALSRVLIRRFAICVLFLILWFCLLIVGSEIGYRSHSRWLSLSRHEYDMINYCRAAILRPGGQSFCEDPTCIGPLRKIVAALEGAGSELMRTGRVSDDLLKAISHHYGAPRETWREQSNMYWYLKTGGGKTCR
jgi:hypothetical protein